LPLLPIGSAHIFWEGEGGLGRGRGFLGRGRGFLGRGRGFLNKRIQEEIEDFI